MKKTLLLAVVALGLLVSNAVAARAVFAEAAALRHRGPYDDCMYQVGYPFGWCTALVDSNCVFDGQCIGGEE